MSSKWIHLLISIFQFILDNLLFLFSKTVLLALTLLCISSPSLRAQSQPSEEKALINSIEELFVSNVHDTIKVNFLLDTITVGMNAYSVPTKKKILSSLIKGKEIAQENQLLESVGELNFLSGKFYRFISQFDSAEIVYTRSLKNFDDINLSNDPRKGHTYLGMTNLYAMSDRGDQAIDCALSAIEVFSATDDSLGIAKSYRAMAYTFSNFKNFDKAIEYGKEGLRIYQKYQDDKGIIYTSYLLSNALQKIGNHEEALVILNNNIEFIKDRILKSKNPFFTLMLTRNYKIRALVLSNLSRYEEALRDIENSHLTASGEDEIDMPPDLLYDKAVIHRKQNKNELAKDVALELINHPDAETSRYDIYGLEILHNCYATLLQYDSAYHYKMLSEKREKTQMMHESSLNMEKLRTEYETEKKDNEIKNQSIALKNQKRVRNLILGIVGLLGAFLIFIYRNSLARKRTNNALAESNKLLDIKNQQNELLLKEIHHRVKNNLEVVSSLLALQSRQLDDASAKSAMQESQNRVQSMGIIHQKLYQGENLAAVEMKDYFVNLGEGVLDSFGKSEQVKITYAMEELELDVDTAVPIGLIVNELLTNALKYAFIEEEKPEIQIKLERLSDNSLKLQVSDNGIGKTKNEVAKGTGFGSQLVQLLTDQLEGAMNYVADQGSHFSFHFKPNNT